MKPFRILTPQCLATLVLTTGIAGSQPTAVATANFDGCPTQGSGGGDPDLNMQKNRSATASGGSPITVAQMDKLPTVPSSDGNTRADWPEDLYDAIAVQEQRAVVLTGYILHAKAEGKESCNCELTAARDHDVHVYVGDDAGDTTAQSAIVEVTPRWRAVHSTWTAQNLQQLATNGIEVRITGWLLYDQEHWAMIKQGQRATLWEIHPVTKIEVQDQTGWVDFKSSSGT